MPVQTKMRLVFGVMVILLFTWTGWQALGFAQLALYLPLAMSGLGVVVGVITVATDLMNWKRQGLVASADVPETAAMHGAEEREIAIREGGIDPSAEDTPEDPHAIALRSLAMMLWILGYVLLIWLVGIVAASAIFLFVFLRLIARASWRVPVIGTLVVLS
ncbi:MAG: hypothetical protein GEV09_27955, partial [Pseudonocardiaceae bacterium]|nr:hypothetical protein [Pseudonocardiaceae bacterium]